MKVSKRHFYLEANVNKKRVFLTVQEAILRIERCGGLVSASVVYPPDRPGLKVLSAIDALVNYHGYKKIAKK